MKKYVKVLLVCFIVCALLTGCTGNTPAQDTLYQVSTLDSLMQGVYDGELMLEELLQRGDFGIGTFDALDGEMVILDGWCPDYLSGINLAGYHLHFLSEDHTMGGHLLECSIENAAISIDTVTQFQMLLPQNEHFLQTDFGGVTEQEKQNVEQ